MREEKRSEVARLRQQIEEEHQAALRAIYGPAMVGGHAFLTARQEQIGRHFERLSEILGSKEEAMIVVAQALEAGESSAQL